MKTKFTQIVKIKKQKLEQVEFELIEVNNAISNANDGILEINKSIKSLSTPMRGTFLQIKHHQDNLNRYIYEIKELKSTLTSLNMKKNQIEMKLKKAHLEYEKIKYLDSVEIKKFLADKKRKDENELNEISIMLHNNKGD